MKKDKKYFKPVVKAYSNEELFERYIELVNGDDYDEYYTKEGAAEWFFVDREFRKRLKSVGYLKAVR